MIPVRLSFWHEYTLASSCGSLFVDTSTKSHTGGSHTGVIHSSHCSGARVSFQYENSSHCHVKAVQHEITLLGVWNGFRMCSLQYPIQNGITTHASRHIVSLHVKMV